MHTAGDRMSVSLHHLSYTRICGRDLDTLQALALQQYLSAPPTRIALRFYYHRDIWFQPCLTIAADAADNIGEADGTSKALSAPQAMFRCVTLPVTVVWFG